MKNIPILVLLAIFIFSGCSGPPDKWSFERDESGWSLYRNGESFYIKGGVPHHSKEYYGTLAEIGGNTVRIEARLNLLDEAKKHGLVAFINLPVMGDRDGFDWDDENAVAEQNHKILEIVTKLKDHKSVMMWSLGNELSYVPGPADANPKLWYHINNLSKLIKEIDPNHPVGFCIGNGGCEVVADISKNCSDIDFFGLNTYRGIVDASKGVESNWSKPFVIAEWGTDGRWQVGETVFDADVEATSSEKAKLFQERYETGILPFRNCVGSLAFFWGHREEGTPTWFSLFVKGKTTESVGVLQKLWTGVWPKNRAPSISRIRLDASVMSNICPFCHERIHEMEKEGRASRLAISEDTGKVICNRLLPGVVYNAYYSFEDPDNDSVTVLAEVRPDARRLEGDYAGNNQSENSPIPDLVISRDFGMVKFQAPSEVGTYRIFIYLDDGEGNISHANMPFHVGDWRD